jgi:hypothetical protein
MGDSVMARQLASFTLDHKGKAVVEPPAEPSGSCTVKGKNKINASARKINPV